MKRHTRFRAANPVQERLAVTLRFLAKGDSYTHLQRLFQISKQTDRQTEPEVCHATVEALMENTQIKKCVLCRANCFELKIDGLEH